MVQKEVGAVFRGSIPSSCIPSSRGSIPSSCSSRHFHFPGSSIFSLKIQVSPEPMSAACTYYRILLVITAAVSSLCLSFLFFVRTSSATVLLYCRDVCEASQSNLLTLALGDGWAIFNRWSRFLYFSALFSAFCLVLILFLYFVAYTVLETLENIWSCINVQNIWLEMSLKNKCAYERLGRAAKACPGDSILLGVKYHLPVGFTGAAQHKSIVSFNRRKRSLLTQSAMRLNRPQHIGQYCSVHFHNLHFLYTTDSHCI